jgi:hypothetical protein
VAASAQPLRSHPLPAYRHGHQRLADPVEERIRVSSISIPAFSPPLLTQTSHLKPGGWLELQEIHHFPQTASDIPLSPTHPVVQFWSLVSEGLGKLGVDFTKTLQLSQLVRDAGFVNVTERVFHVPIGTWPKNRTLKICGMWWKTILLDGLSPIALGPLTRGLGWRREEVETFLVSVRESMKEAAGYMYMPLHVIYAQRPADDV